MSTKTTFKRISLVTVAALGLGVVTSVAPATAAINFRASYTAPTAYDTLVASVGVGGTVANIGTVQLDLATIDSPLGAGTDTTTVTVTANDGTVAKDVNFAGAMTMSLSVSGTTTLTTTAYNASAGYNPLNNGAVTISGLAATLTGAAASYTTASGKVFLNVARASLVATDTGAKVKITQTVSTGGSISTYVSFITLTIGTKAGTATTPVTTGTVAAGGTVTASYVQPYTNVAANDAIAPTAFTLTNTIASGVPTHSVTAVVTGGSATMIRTSASVITPSLLKDGLTGALSVTYTISVTVPSTAAAGETVSVYGYTWTVTPYTPVYNNSVLTVSNGANGYRVSTASGGDGIAHALASDKSNPVITVAIQQIDQNGANITAPAYAKTVSATITGKGSLAVLSSVDAVVKTATESLINGQLSGNDSFVVYSEGTSGEGSLAISVNNVVVATYKLRFLGDAASVTATLVYTIGSTSAVVTGSDGVAVGRTNNLGAAGQTKDVTADSDPAIAVSVLDSNGWAIPTIAPVASSSKLTVVSGASRMFIDSGVSDLTLGKYSAGTFVQHYNYSTVASASGSTSALTFTFVNAAGTALVSPAITVTTGGAIASATLKFDADSYLPGAVAKITATALDSSGNKAYDGQNVMSNGLLSTLSFTKPASIVIDNGTKVKTVNAPMATGTWTITAYDYADRAYTAKATITNQAAEATAAGQAALAAAEAATDAAAEATDAANAATDAANAAAEAADAATAAAQDASDAVAALSAQVATLIAGLKAQLTALTNLIIKIQKKVKA